MRQIPVLTSMKKTRDTPFLKNYTLHYINSEGGEKVYETVSNFDYDDPTFRGDDAYYWEETYGAWVLKELKGDPAGISDYLTMCQLMWEETGGKGYSDPTGLVEDPLLPYAEISDPSEGTYDPSIDANWSEEYELWIPAKIYGDSEEMLAYYEKLIAIGEANYAAEH